MTFKPNTKKRELRIEHVNFVESKDPVLKSINTSRLHMLCKDILEGRLDAVKVWYSKNNFAYFDKKKAAEFIKENECNIITKVERKQPMGKKSDFIVGFSAPLNAFAELQSI